MPENNRNEQSRPIQKLRRAGRGLLDPARRKKGIYILPNLFTTAALFSGFYAIVNGMNGQFQTACIAIFIAMVLDGLDGRVARMTHTQSEFGAQFDSLADMVSFGAAPALVMYEWALKPMGKWGWAGAFIYCACAALRLARFNTNIDVIDKRFFQGLPSPAAAAVVAGMIWVLSQHFAVSDVRYFAWGLTVIAGVTMITNIKYYSGKEINLRGTVPFWVIPLIFLVYLIVTIEPSHVLWGLFVCYLLSGYVLGIISFFKTDMAPPETNQQSINK